jgi:hypothetical protein
MDLIGAQWLIWLVVGMGLAFLELFMPGLVIIFMALGCWIVAGALLIWPLTLTQQCRRRSRHGDHSHECLEYNEGRVRGIAR